MKRKLYELKHTGAGMAIEAGANIRDVQLHLSTLILIQLKYLFSGNKIYLMAFKSSTSKEFIEKFPEL